MAYNCGNIMQMLGTSFLNVTLILLQTILLFSTTLDDILPYNVWRNNRWSNCVCKFPQSNNIKRKYCSTEATKSRTMYLRSVKYWVSLSLVESILINCLIILLFYFNLIFLIALHKLFVFCKAILNKTVNYIMILTFIIHWRIG